MLVYSKSEILSMTDICPGRRGASDNIHVIHCGPHHAGATTATAPVRQRFSGGRPPISWWWASADALMADALPAELQPRHRNVGTFLFYCTGQTIETSPIFQTMLAAEVGQ